MNCIKCLTQKLHVTQVDNIVTVIYTHVGDWGGEGDTLVTCSSSPPNLPILYIGGVIETLMKPLPCKKLVVFYGHSNL